MKALGFVVVVLLAVGCTDAQLARVGALGDEAAITCYSGGQKVFEDRSTGKIQAGESGAGLFYRSKTTGHYIRAYADCIIVSD